MGEIPWLLLFFSKGTRCLHYLFVLKSHRMLSCCLTPFHLPPAPDQLSEEFYFIPAPQPGLSSLLLLVSFPHPLKITFLYSRHFIFTYLFVQYSYSPSTFIKLHSAVIGIDPTVVLLQFCPYWTSIFLTVLQT